MSSNGSGDDNSKRIARLVDAAHTHVIENGAIDRRSAAARKRTKHINRDPMNRNKSTKPLSGLPTAKQFQLPKGNFIQTARNDSNTRLILRTFINGKQMAWITFNKKELGRVMNHLHLHYITMVDEDPQPE